MDSERQTMPLTPTSQVSTARKVNFANSDKLQNSILPEFAQHAVFVRTAVRHDDTPKIALHMQGTDLHPKEPNPELPHVIPLVPGILHYVQESSEEL